MDLLIYLLISKMFTLIAISAENLDVSNLSNNFEEISASGTFSGRIKKCAIKKQISFLMGEFLHF